MDPEFARDLVHQLRNPLNALALQIELARRRLLGPEEHLRRAQEALESAVYELDRLRAVLDELIPDQRCRPTGMLAGDASE